MRTSFQLIGIDHAPFQALFGLSDEALKEHGAVRRFAQQSPGYPCRVSLEVRLSEKNCSCCPTFTSPPPRPTGRPVRSSFEEAPGSAEGPPGKSPATSPAGSSRCAPTTPTT
jgi:hypothetical protein